MSEFPSEGLSRFASLPPRARSSTLVRALADLFVLSAEHRRDDIYVFEELFLSVYPDADIGDRVYAAELLADRTDLPAAVAAMVGLDEIRPARPMLERSAAFTPLDLTRIVCLRSGEHRILIAARAALDRTVVSALLHFLDRDVAAVLLDNADAVLDAEALETIRAKTGLHRAVAERLSEIIGGPDAAGVAGFFEADRAARSAALAELAAETAFRQPEARGRHGAAAPPELGRELLRLATAGDREALAASLADALSIERSLARRIVEDRGGEPFALALAALGIDEPEATSLILWASPEPDRSYWRTRELVQLRAEVGWRTAQAAIDRWRGPGPERSGEIIRQLDPSSRHQVLPKPAERRRLQRGAGDIRRA